jgi:hypothetical protein
MEKIDSLSTTADILCILGWLTPEQTAEILARQEAEQGSGRDPGHLSDIAIARGMCTEEQGSFAEQVRGHLSTTYQWTKVVVRISSGSFASIMVGLGFLEREDFYATINWQMSEMRCGRDPGEFQRALVRAREAGV